jgi:hypothetical protein
MGLFSQFCVQAPRFTAEAETSRRRRLLRRARHQQQCAGDSKSLALIKLRCTASLRRRNEKATLRIRALRPAPITSREVHSAFCCNRRTIVSQIPAMELVLSKTRSEENMLNKLLAAAAMAAIAYAIVPANAAKMSAGCSSANLSKTESSIEAMADGDGKIAAQKEVALAQDAMLTGKMGACGVHLGKAMHDAGMSK